MGRLLDEDVIREFVKTHACGIDLNNGELLFADYNANGQMFWADLLSAVPDYSGLLHKWVAFRQEGMRQVLHGRIVFTRPDGLLYVRCKNAATRFVEAKDVLKIFDNKIECYEYKEE